jgi:hypothetical protein
MLKTPWPGVKWEETAGEPPFRRTGMVRCEGSGTGDGELKNGRLKPRRYLRRLGRVVVRAGM